MSGPVRMVRTWWLLLGVITLLLVFLPYTRVTVRHDALSFTLETVSALVATMVAFVGLAGYVFERRAFDLAIAAAFGVFALTAFVFGLVLPFKGYTIDAAADAPMYAWLVARSVAGVLLMLGLRAERPGRLQLVDAARFLGMVVTSVALVDVVLWHWRDRLPNILDPAGWDRLSHGGGGTLSMLDGQTWLGIGLESLVALLYFWLALRLSSSVAHHGEDAWLALSMITAAVAAFQFIFYPSPFHPAITTADFLWLVSYVLLLAYLGDQYIRASSQVRRQQERTSALLALSQTPVASRNPGRVLDAARRAVRVVGPDVRVRVVLDEAVESNWSWRDPTERRFAIRVDGTSYGWLSVQLPEGTSLDHDTEEYLRLVANQTASLLHAIELYGELAESAVWDERAQLARDLHDGLAQDLAVLRLRLGSGDGIDRQLVDRALSEARYAITILRGQTAAPADFFDALQRQAEDLSDRFDCAVVVEKVEPMPEIPATAQVALLRIIREAVTNAGKHGHPSRIAVSLRQHEGAIEVEVADDGAGFDPSQPNPPGRFGLAGMSERAALLGGTLAVTSRPDGGTVVRVALPTDVERGIR